MLLLFNKDLILLGLRKYSVNNCVWTLPGGRCQEGEAIYECIARE